MAQTSTTVAVLTATIAARPPPPPAPAPGAAPPGRRGVLLLPLKALAGE